MNQRRHPVEALATQWEIRDRLFIPLNRARAGRRQTVEAVETAVSLVWAIAPSVVAASGFAPVRLRTVQRVKRTCADVTKTTPSAAKFRFAAPTADAGFSAGILTSSGRLFLYCFVLLDIKLIRPQLGVQAKYLLHYIPGACAATNCLVPEALDEELWLQEKVTLMPCLSPATRGIMNGLIYLIGLIVVIMAILSFLGLH
jgi:hypothetical protein